MQWTVSERSVFFSFVVVSIVFVFSLPVTLYAQSVPVGSPSYDRSQDSAMFVWSDAPGHWKLRASGGATSTRYTGTLVANKGFTRAIGTSLESSDTLDSTNPTLIRFELSVTGEWEDGIDFQVPPGSDVCMNLESSDYPSGQTVHVLLGPDREPVAVPLNLNDKQPCQAFTPMGEPLYDPATDTSIFLWSSEKNTWHLRATAGVDSVVYKGRVESSLPLLSVKPVSLEGTDSILVRNEKYLHFDLNLMAGFRDGFDFVLDDNATACFRLNRRDSSPGVGVMLGAARTPMDKPFDLHTLRACDVPYNLVVILTDDQRFDSLWAMPNLQRYLLDEGVSFTNAYITTPLCCPARASIYSGGFYAHNTGVLRNSGDNGGPDLFEDLESMPRLLQKQGYKTMFTGKYFALYAGYPGGVKVAPYIPPGWDQFIGRSIYATKRDWWDFEYAQGSTTDLPMMGTTLHPKGQYTTYFERDQVLSFIDSVGNNPYFVLLSTTAPHDPAMPAVEDADLFADYVYRERGYGETDLSDKPQWVHEKKGRAYDDDFIRRQLQTLQAVDRSVASIVEKVTSTGMLDRTVFLYLSDNGFLWGEHGLWGKAKPYEEAVRVPFVVRMPGLVPRLDNHLVAANLDLGATLFALAGIDKPSDGMNLLPLLRNENPSWREELLLESFGYHPGGDGVWAALRSGPWKYIENPGQRSELYHLDADPYELDNKSGDPAYAQQLETLRARLEPMKGLNILTFPDAVPRGRVGEAYHLQLTAWGGSQPYRWRIQEGALPLGLVLNDNTGVVSGIPLQPETTEVSFRVEGLGLETYSLRQENFVSQTMKMIIE